MANLPIYRQRLHAAVREAQAEVVAGAREYDAMRDEALESVKDQFALAQSQQEMLHLFRNDILPKARQTLDVSIRDYEVGKVDFLQLIDNWRQVLRFTLAEQRLDTDLRQSLAMLERTVGQLEPDQILADSSDAVAPLPSPTEPIDRPPPTDASDSEPQPSSWSPPRGPTRNVPEVAR
jgi:outer membrane protein TolC